jgi:hypothetical protein
MEKKHFILYHNSDVKMEKMLDENYDKFEEKIDTVINDLVLLRRFLSASVIRKGKSLVLAQTNNTFFRILYKCFKDEYKDKVDIVII